MSFGKNGDTTRLRFAVVNDLGALVSGLLDAAFTKTLRKDTASSAVSVTVTELGSTGLYEATAACDANGEWSLLLEHSVYGKWFGQWSVKTRDSDDLAYPATSGRSLAVSVAGAVDANLAAGAITSASFGAGAIDAAAIAADAIGASELAADAVAEIAAAVAAGSVASVVGAVGSVTGAVGSVTGDVGGKVLGGGSGTITGTGARADVRSWNGTAPSNLVSGRVDVTVGAMQTDTLDANALKADAAAEIAAAVSVPSAADVADAVWDEALAGHTTAGTTGKKLGDLSTTAPPSAATIAAAVADEALSGHTTAGSLGEAIKTLRTGVLSTGTAQGGTTTTIQLAAGETAQAEAYYGAILTIVSGTGAPQTRSLGYYNSTSKTATVTYPFATAPDNTSVYRIEAGPTEVLGVAIVGPSAISATSLDAGTINSSKIADGTITAAKIASNAITAAKIATDAIGAAQLAADAVAEIQSGLAVPGDAMTLEDGAISPGKIVDSTLGAAKFADDAITASKIAANAIGSSQLAASAVSEIAAAVSVPSAATIAAAVADEALSGHTTAGSLGEALLRLRSAILGSGTLQSASVLDATASSDDQAYRGALLIPTGGTGVGQGGKLIATYDGTTKAFTTYANFGTSLDNTTTYVILAVSDYSRYVGDLLGTVAALGAGAISGSSISAGAITASKFGTGAITSTVLADDAITAAKIAADAIGASELAADAATEIADALLDRTSAIDGATPRDTLARIAASSHGKVSGMASGTPTFLGQDGSTSRIVATVDADGNRTAVTLP